MILIHTTWFQKHYPTQPRTPQPHPKNPAATGRNALQLSQPSLSSQAGAGVNSEFSDEDFKDAGAEVLTDAQAVMNKAPGGGGAGTVEDVEDGWSGKMSYGDSFDPPEVVFFLFFMVFGGYKKNTSLNFRCFLMLK